MKNIKWMLDPVDGEPTEVCPVSGSVALNREPEGLWCGRCHEHHGETMRPAKAAMQCAMDGDYTPGPTATCLECGWLNEDHVYGNVMLYRPTA